MEYFLHPRNSIHFNSIQFEFTMRLDLNPEKSIKTFQYSLKCNANKRMAKQCSKYLSNQKKNNNIKYSIILQKYFVMMGWNKNILNKLKCHQCQWKVCCKVVVENKNHPQTTGSICVCAHWATQISHWWKQLKIPKPYISFVYQADSIHSQRQLLCKCFPKFQNSFQIVYWLDRSPVYKICSPMKTRNQRFRD